MFYLVTKEDREKSRAYQFTNLIQSGYIQTNYKNLVIFTNSETLLLKTFWGTAAKHTDFIRYRTAERMAEKVEELKRSADSREQYAAEQKERNKGKKSGHAAASAAIKEELKKVFPDTKFSVKSEGYSGGNSVRISWNDGPTNEQVTEFTAKYQFGSFNGMEDIYEYTNSRSDIPQAKYVSESRGMSDEAKAILQPIADEMFEGFKKDNDDFKPYNCWDAGQFLYRIFSKVSFPAGAKPTGIIPTGETCGVSLPEVFYTISFDVAGQTQPEAAKQPETKGKVQIVSYSEKSIAVIGETYEIRSTLKELGGRFNKFLSCGAGWIFPVSKLDELKAALTKPKEAETTLKDEIQKTVQFFADMDVKNTGEVSESTREIAAVQDVEIVEPEFEVYSSLKDITEAAKSGKVISLYNLSQLVNV